ncbi:coiledcoil domain containing, partial [Perkinsus olseni]
VLIEVRRSSSLRYDRFRISILTFFKFGVVHLLKDAQDAEKKSIEAEIQQLQRNFHVLENDKRNYGEVSQGVIRKQRATIMKLSRENKKMKQEVNDTRAFTASRSEHKIGSERLQRTQEEKDRIDARLRDESARGEL